MCTSCKVQINGKGGQFSVAEGGQFYIAANTVTRAAFATRVPKRPRRLTACYVDRRIETGCLLNLALCVLYFGILQ
jgi:hypothetical protein